MITVKPPALRPGDTIGFVSPSGGIAQLAPHRVDKGKQALEAMGFKVKLAPNAMKKTGYTAGSETERASDLNLFFRDSEIKAIVAVIGGFHSNQLLKHLDFELIKRNPKIFCGFSDMSVLHFALYTQANLTTFYGPAVLTQFGEAFGVHPYTREHFERIVTRAEPFGAVKASEEWTDEFLNWFTKADLERPRQMQKNPGFKWLKPGKAEGIALGGCITALLHMRGTRYWPDFGGSVFFWELPESSADPSKGEPVSRADAHLTDLELSGVFSACKGMIVGRPKGYSVDDAAALERVIVERTRAYDFPILSNVDIGHTDPIMTLPLGVRVRLDSERNGFEILDAAVR